ncbi:MAG TPA: hypothetical protein VJB18_04425 [Burkholderiales bacterium]|nr:hypothetical protein [Burkholderiales bacterium]
MTNYSATEKVTAAIGAPAAISFIGHGISTDFAGKNEISLFGMEYDPEPVFWTSLAIWLLMGVIHFYGKNLRK